jgi:DNA-binding TFAR19-related protein (PDSD5 family)
MTKLLSIAVTAVEQLPEAAQDAIARQIMAMVSQGRGTEQIPDEDMADVLAGLADVERGDTVSEEAFWKMLDKAE